MQNHDTSIEQSTYLMHLLNALGPSGRRFPLIRLVFFCRNANADSQYHRYTTLQHTCLHCQFCFAKYVLFTLRFLFYRVFAKKKKRIRLNFPHQTGCHKQISRFRSLHRLLSDCVHSLRIKFFTKSNRYTRKCS